MINQFYIDYIKAIENPDRVGWNGKVWTAPQYKGYDKNQRGYGIDIVKNDSAKRLTQNRPGQWLTEGEADKLMKEHLLYVYGAAQKHIEGFDNLSDRRKAALLGMLYRGDSVNKNRHIIDINEPDDNKFFESISNYYKSKGLNERARNSSNFFNNNQLTNFLIPMKWEQWEPPMKFKSGGQIRKMLTASGGPLVNESTKVEKPIISIPKKIIKSQLSDDNSWEKTDNNKVHIYPNLRNDKYVQEFFLYDYAPRFKRLNNFASRNYVNAALNIYKRTPINIYNEDGNAGGYQTGGERRNFNNFFTKLINPSYIPSSIYLNENYKMNRPTLVHELTHAFRLGYLGITGDSRFSSAKRPIYNLINKEIGNEYYGSGYSNSEKDILNNTYDMEGYKIDYDPLYEKGTTNTEVRFRLWKELYDQLGRRPSLEETDRYIRTYNGEKLLRIIREANAYGKTMYDNGMLTNLIKNALINVAQNNSNNTYLLNDQTYYAKQGGKMNILEFLKKGSGIHIKEKNKGKFTSYCGGKVTDECILKGKNSSSPAIRKRATFAANARKWKHKEGGIIKAEDGLSTSLLGLLPGVGTYLDYKEFEKNPNWKTGLSLGVSALGDATMLTGAGALIKGISAANKARKILGTAGKAANVARLLVWNQASKLKRESDAVNSLTLMGAPTNKILERLTSKNLAKKSYEEALKNDKAALKVYLTAANSPAFNFNSSQFVPLIYTNPGFHAGSLAIKHKLGGIIKAEEGTKTNWISKIGEGINKGVNSKAGLYITQGLLLGLGSIFGGNNSSDISNVAKNYNIQQLNAYDELELYKLYSLMKSSVDPENPNANKGVPMQILPGKIRDIEKRMLERQIQLEEINTLLKLDNQKSNLYLDIFSTALGVISNNNSNKTTKNNTSQLNGSPSKTTITSTNNNILKTGYEPYKSGYIDLFGNISTGIGFKFDKNFNVVPFNKSFNYQPLKLNV